MAVAAAAVVVASLGPASTASAEGSDGVSVEALVASRAQVQRLLGPLPSDEADDDSYRAVLDLHSSAPVGWSDDMADRLTVAVDLVTGGPGPDGEQAPPSLDVAWRLFDCDAEGVCDEGREVVAIADAQAAMQALDVTVRPTRVRVRGTVPAELLRLTGIDRLPIDLSQGAQIDLDVPIPKVLRSKTSASVTGDVVLTTGGDGSELSWHASRTVTIDLPERVQRVATLWADESSASVTRSWAGSLDRPGALPRLGGAQAQALVAGTSFRDGTVSGQVELSTDEPVLTDAGVPLRGTRQVSRMGVMMSSDGGPWVAGAAFRAALTHLDCADDECAEVGRGESGAGVAPTATPDGDVLRLSVGTATASGTVTSTVDVDLGDVEPTFTVSAVRATDGGWRWTSRLTLVADAGTYSGSINGTPAQVRVVSPLTWTLDVDSWRTSSREGPAVAVLTR